MAALSVAVTALAVAVGFEFLLLFGLLRRVRIEASLRSTTDPDLPKSGTMAPAFSVRTTDGELVNQAFYDQGPVLLGFFTQDCSACDVAKNELLREPLGLPFLAFVQAPPAHVPSDPDLVADLSTAGACVATFDRGDGLMARFSVAGFPSLLRVEDGRVSVASYRVRDIRTPKRAPTASWNRNGSDRTRTGVWGRRTDP